MLFGSHLNRRAKRRVVAAANRSLQQTPGRLYSLPAPTGGWNALDPLDAMAPEDASIMDNFIPDARFAELRRGYTSHATGMSGLVETLMTWSGPTSEKMFAANSTNIYDVSASGAVGAAAVSSLTNARWHWTNFATGGGQYLYIANQADAPRYYNGTSWATSAITGTGVTATDWGGVIAHKQRLFFTVKNSLEFGYLDVETLTGAVGNVFDVGPYCNLGGYGIALASVSIDGGDGPDDYFAFITSNGEVIAYQGTNPGDAAAWSMVGSFRIPKPLGPRCVVDFGGDAIIMTENGFVSLLQQIRTDLTRSKAVAVSGRIDNALKDIAPGREGVWGWQAFRYPARHLLMFNIPITISQTYHQYIQNALYGRFARFTGMNSVCWALYDGEPYFGGTDGVVYRADTGASDNDANIEGEIRWSFNHLKMPERRKVFLGARPLITSDATIEPVLQANIDFEDVQPSNVPTSTAVVGPEWDAILWDVEMWGSPETTQNNWAGLTGEGYFMALRMKIGTNSATCKVSGAQILYRPGTFV